MDFIRKTWWFDSYLWIFNYTRFHYSKCWLFIRHVRHPNPWYGFGELPKVCFCVRETVSLFGCKETWGKVLITLNNLRIRISWFINHKRICSQWRTTIYSSPSLCDYFSEICFCVCETISLLGCKETWGKVMSKG